MDELLLRLVDLPKINGTLAWVSGRCYEYNVTDRSWIRQKERDDASLYTVLLCSGRWRLDPTLEAILVLQLAILNTLGIIAAGPGDPDRSFNFPEPRHYDPFWE